MTFAQYQGLGGQKMPNSINGNQGEKTGDCHSAGSEDELAQTATMLETWAPECFPEVNEW